MIPRTYAPDMELGSSEVSLPPEESAHLARVLRIREGDPVHVFNGRGLARSGVAARVGRHRVEVTLGGPCPAAPEPRVRITLAQALLKGDKFDDVVRDATMLGAAAVVPLVTAHIDVPRAAVREGGRLDRWRRIAAGSAGQCGRAVVPELPPPVAFEDALAADTSAVRLVLGEPSLPEARLRFDAALAREVAAAASVFVAVGPEGGWSAEEIRLAEASRCRIVGLGERTLRADAAPLVAISVLLYASGSL